MISGAEWVEQFYRGSFSRVYLAFLVLGQNPVLLLISHSHITACISFVSPRETIYFCRKWQVDPIEGTLRWIYSFTAMEFQFGILIPILKLVSFYMVVNIALGIEVGTTHKTAGHFWPSKMRPVLHVALKLTFRMYKVGA